MLKKNPIISCVFCVLVLCNLLTALLLHEREEIFQKTIDNQLEMLYNKDTLLQEKDDEIQILKQEAIFLQEELGRREEGTALGRVISCETSAYTSGDGETPSDIMANGEVVHVGAVACNFLPFGTKVRINGNVYTVKDRCGVDNCIDIYMETYEECERWGRRIIEVEILQ